MLIIGNWKMHGDRAGLAELVAIDRAVARVSGVDVAVCPPATLIGPACERVRAVAVGAQDCHPRDGGAFTGGVSAAMLVEAGAQLVLVGHSECREEGPAGDALVRAKADAAVVAELAPIVCVGEPAGGEAVTAVAAQLAASLPTCPMPGLAVAYEPIWAIGTGRVPTTDAIAATLTALRQVVCAQYGEAEGQRVPLLYGGSVDGGNAAALLAIAGLGGLLVGGASLTAATFLPILRAADRRR